MTDLDRPRLALYIALGVVVCVLGARYLGVQGSAGGVGAERGAGGAASVRPPGGAHAGDPASAGVGAGAAGAAGHEAAGPATVRVERADDGRVTVHVAGAVRRPGLYRLRAGSRIDDALRRAGGPAPRADLTAVNLATKLEDGRQVLVPERPQAVSAGGPPGAASPAAGAGSGAPTAAPTGPVSLNAATLEQLDTLDGVGPGIAQRIIDYREQHGGFHRVDELGEVSGIGPKRLASLTAQVTL